MRCSRDSVSRIGRVWYCDRAVGKKRGYVDSLFLFFLLGAMRIGGLLWYTILQLKVKSAPAGRYRYSVRE